MQAEIIKILRTKKNISPQEEILFRINFLKSYLIKSNAKGFVLGISGGQDSTLCGKLAQMAIEELRQESKEVFLYAIRLPYGIQKDEADAQKALDFIKADFVYTFNIKKATDEIIKTLEQDENIKISDFNKGNIKARQRMVVQYAIAAQKNALVIGTDHAAEALTGFFTKFGDNASDLLPIAELNKRQGKELLKFLQADPSLYNKIPTADLEDNKPLLPDETALGVSYEEIDDYLEGKIINEKSKNIIENLYLKSLHKRNLPPKPSDFK